MLNKEVELYKAGLISKAELQRAIDFENMGSDTRFILIEDLI
tara:strand:+ start:405 stop:530 length:126 start_codon:yes stop_codon:yes gene_type:complete